jgi:hypothetical protein
MGHDVFISYPHQDKVVADAACAKLEAEGIRCWIAPRDVAPGAEWAGAIVDAIDNCRVMILIFSYHANQSRQVYREVQRAFDGEKPVVPFRIENIVPQKSLAYYMGSVHWLDALTPPVERHLGKLVGSVLALVAEEAKGAEEERRKSEADTEENGIAALDAEPLDDEAGRQPQPAVGQQRAESERLRADERRLREDAGVHPEETLAEVGAVLFRSITARASGLLRITNRRLLFAAGQFNMQTMSFETDRFSTMSAEIPLTDIAAISKCKTAGFIPNGILLITKAGVELRFGLELFQRGQWGRDKLIEIISARIGLREKPAQR